ncbi:MAG TPA: acetate/propionate family kinase [Bryobacteraceae bacterium]|nr:acetate/propionate family kinase [Bryobacteraceae bacterium]
MSTGSRILTINGGSSTIKFAVFTSEEPPERILSGQLEHIGPSGAVLNATEPATAQSHHVPVSASDHRQAAGVLIDWIAQWNGHDRFAAIGHRVVHGGLTLDEHQVVTPELMRELCRTQPLDLAHLPREIALIEAFRDRFPGITQIACFDTAFHSELPRIAKLLPIPRRYTDAGVRRLGFHGLSYMYLIGELRRVAGSAADGRVIIAHLGSGASMAALLSGRPVDTSMAFTPTAGLMMGTRPGDLDPGLLVYMMRTEKLTPEQMDDFVSHRCGMTGVSDGISDMRELISRRAADTKAAEAVDLFCYQAKKWIGAYAAVLGGLDTLVFSGGIGERSPEARSGICGGLEFLGLHLDAALNSASAAVISTPASRVAVRVIPTDEELMVANIVFDLIADRAKHKQ